VKSVKHTVDPQGTRENHELNEVRSLMRRCQIVQFKFIIISSSINTCKSSFFDLFYALSNINNILTFEFKVTLIFINIYMQIFIYDETTASLVRALTSFNVKRRSYLLEQVTYAVYVVQCQEKVVSFRTSHLDWVLNHTNQIMFNVETSYIYAYLH
jgi:hypothetical protein